MFDFKKLFFIAILSSLLVIPAMSSTPRPVAEDEMMTTVTVDQLKDMLKEMGIEATTAEDEPEPATLSWKDEERKTEFNLISYTSEDGEATVDLMIQAVVTAPDDEKISMEAVNDWNTISRFGRAYVSDEMLYIEFDLRLSKGVSKAAIMEFLTGFQDTFSDAFDQIVAGEGVGG